MPLARDCEQPEFYRRMLRDHLDWFDVHLPEPDRFYLRMDRAIDAIGVCWFKAEARQQIARMRDMSAVLYEIGHAVSFRCTLNPGPVIYQDDFQIVALDYSRPRISANVPPTGHRCGRRRGRALWW